ncbi:MAG: methionyl-tRNA formyltransferase [Treponema sp.]|jgi:methionyl-tRNA formyltransferase|nr:methionyl-tRNA formyltransferase [Treponema sp.]
MRIVYAGSPGIAVPALKTLADLEQAGAHQIVGILTNPDSPRGRHGKREPTELSVAASLLSEKRKAQGLPALMQLKPEKLSAEVLEQLVRLKPDLLISFAYGHIFSPQFLELFPQGGINIHPSLLPRYRGPTPIQAAILAGDKETGITIQTLAKEMDAGDILLQTRFLLSGEETTGDVSALVAHKAAALLMDLLKRPGQGLLRGQPQAHEKATFCSLIRKEDGRIDWSASAARIAARIRALTPWPLAWTLHGEQYLFILEGKPFTQGELGTETKAPAPSGTVLGIDKQGGILIQTGEGVLGVTRLQYRSKKALIWKAFLNGVRNFIGSSLG